MTFSLSAQDFTQSPAYFLYDSVLVTIHRDFTADIRYRQRIAFNRDAPDKYTSISIHLNKYISLEDIQVATDLPDGRRVLLSDSDIQTVSDFGPQYYPDSKTKIVPLPLIRENARTTIEYTLHYGCLLYLPEFIMQRDIPSARAGIVIRSRIPCRYYCSPGTFKADSVGNALNLYAEEIPAYETEEGSPVDYRYRVFLRPNTILYENDIYPMRSWDDVAAFYNRLAFPNEYPDKLIAHLADSLCRYSKDQNDSLLSLFTYVRENIRYISADIGRGDFKPLNPIQIVNRRIGDCKDQSTLLISLIRSMGFAAYPALAVSSDKPNVIDSLPWPGYFDHVIAAVNTANGFLFLDASQQSCCFGKTPISIRNRPLLICRDSNSYPVIPAISEHGNAGDINLIYRIKNNGDINCHVHLALYRDMAFGFYDSRPELVSSNIKDALFSSIPADQYRMSFHLENNSPDLIMMSGEYVDRFQSVPDARELALKVVSPSFEYLKRKFRGKDRRSPFAFPYPFRLKETIDIIIEDSYSFKNDSLIIDYNECGLQYYIQVYSRQTSYRAYKFFQLAGYTLPAECYDRFKTFLPKTIQTISRSMDIISTTNNVKGNTP
jgi:transglutaminase-like putative cysteine protease